MLRFSISHQQATDLRNCHDCRENGIQDVRPLNIGNRGRLIRVLLAARMIARTHVAVSCHLLAAFHLDLCHGRFRNTRKGRRSRPHQDQNKRQDGTPLHHVMMLHLLALRGKGSESNRPHQRFACRSLGARVEQPWFVEILTVEGQRQRQRAGAPALRVRLGSEGTAGSSIAPSLVLRLRSE
jgi:hypothetical protein